MPQKKIKIDELPSLTEQFPNGSNRLWQSWMEKRLPSIDLGDTPPKVQIGEGFNLTKE